MTQLVHDCLETYDQHLLTDSHLVEDFFNQNIPDNTDKKHLFDNLNNVESIQLLEMAQISILLEENRYLLSHFDHAINRMYLKM
ncbi:hypothetical protein [Reichenbachiella ulvae]|uniref:Uncharacterized protein n=1 Tax=Reichenbachiella ulvae TaxID=2980104 RepID=A0ABT3CXE2_9BACT|nr:hypothetical protein [Reichenbachiella ulvae]MCV9388371.1 hypothetical protein [Reichenbachiella ulvae]